MCDCYGRTGAPDVDNVIASRKADRTPYPGPSAGHTPEAEPGAGGDLRRDAAGGDLVVAAVRLGVPHLAEGGASGLRLPAPDLAQSGHGLQLPPGDQPRAAAG